VLDASSKPNARKLALINWVRGRGNRSLVCVLWTRKNRRKGKNLQAKKTGEIESVEADGELSAGEGKRGDHCFSNNSGRSRSGQNENFDIWEYVGVLPTKGGECRGGVKRKTSKVANGNYTHKQCTKSETKLGGVAKENERRGEIEP